MPNVKVKYGWRYSYEYQQKIKKLSALLKKIQDTEDLIVKDKQRNIYKRQKITASKAGLIAYKNLMNIQFSKNRKIYQTVEKQMIEVYELIQEIRSLITEQKQVDYRLYSTKFGANGEVIDIRHIGVDGINIKDYLYAEEAVLRVNADKIQKDINWIEKALVQDKAMQATFDKVLNLGKIKAVTNSSGQRVYMYNEKKYNLGHIVEAIDELIYGEREDGSTISEQLMKDTQGINFNTIVDQLANEFEIKANSVSGFRGGDTDLTQVKANKAQLMSYHNIYTMGKTLEQIEQKISSGAVPDKVITDWIMEAFSGSGQAAIDESIFEDQIVNQIVAQIPSMFGF